MRGMRVESPWRTAQVFISSQLAGVFEVEVETKTKELRCSCPVFAKTKDCKHTSFVFTRMERNSGHYAILIPENIPEFIARAANTSQESFRDFVIKFAKVEVL